MALLTCKRNAGAAAHGKSRPRGFSAPGKRLRYRPAPAGRAPAQAVSSLGDYPLKHHVNILKVFKASRSATQKGPRKTGEAAAGNKVPGFLTWGKTAGSTGRPRAPSVGVNRPAEHAPDPGGRQRSRRVLRHPRGTAPRAPRGPPAPAAPAPPAVRRASPQASARLHVRSTPPPAPASAAPPQQPPPDLASTPEPLRARPSGPRRLPAGPRGPKPPRAPSPPSTYLSPRHRPPARR